MVAGPVLEREEHPPAEQILLDPVEGTAEKGPELVQRRPEIARLMKLGIEPGVPEGLRVGDQIATPRIACVQCRTDRLGGEHPGLHRRVDALDLGEIERPGVATEQQTAGERLLRQAVEPTLGNGPRAVAQALAAFQVFVDFGLRLEALELLEGRQIGIGVVEIGDQTDDDLIVFHMVEEGTTGGAVLAERPAGTVNDEPRLVLGRIDLPQLLDTDAVMLRRRAGGEIVPGDQLLAELAACAFGKQCVLAVQFDSGLETILRLALLVASEIAGRHTLDRAVLVVEHLGGGKTRKDLDTEGFSLLGQPTAKRPQADHEVARVMHRRGDGKTRQAGRCALAAIEEDLVLTDRRVHRRSSRLPVGKQFIERPTLEQRPGKDVRPHLGALLEHHDPEVGIDLLETNRRTQTRRPGADNHYVILHRFTFHRNSSRFSLNRSGPAHRSNEPGRSFTPHSQQPHYLPAYTAAREFGQAAGDGEASRHCKRDDSKDDRRPRRIQIKWRRSTYNSRLARFCRLSDTPAHRETEVRPWSFPAQARHLGGKQK